MRWVWAGVAAFVLIVAFIFHRQQKTPDSVATVSTTRPRESAVVAGARGGVPVAGSEAVATERSISANSTLSQWLADSGYGLMEDFMTVDVVASVPGTSLQRDYQGYDLATLRGLADQGDATAAFYYAMNGKVADKDAAAYFESALVNGGYPVAGFQAALRFDNMAFDKQGSPLYERLRANPAMTLEPEEASYLLWLATAAQLNDPLGKNLLDTQILPSLSEAQRTALNEQAKQNLQRLNELRASRNLPALTPMTLSPEARAYIRGRYFDQSAMTPEPSPAEGEELPDVLRE